MITYWLMTKTVCREGAFSGLCKGAEDQSNLKTKLEDLQEGLQVFPPTHGGLPNAGCHTPTQVPSHPPPQQHRVAKSHQHAWGSRQGDGLSITLTSRTN